MGPNFEPLEPNYKGRYTTRTELCLFGRDSSSQTWHTDNQIRKIYFSAVSVTIVIIIDRMKEERREEVSNFVSSLINVSLYRMLSQWIYKY